MAEQENKELSMAEILASIRKILEESGADEALRRKEAEEEVFELQPSMIVREEPAPAAKPEIPAELAAKIESMIEARRQAKAEKPDIGSPQNKSCGRRNGGVFCRCKPALCRRGRVFHRRGGRFFFARSYCRPAGRKSCRGSGRRKSGRRKKHSGGRNGFAAGSFRRGTR